ncbi:DUF4349 domain-containing protein [Candidatus Omnitrophota bacterium]
MFKRHVFNQLSAYLDKQLSEKKKEKVEQHLQECTECSQELARLKMVSDKLRDIEVPDLYEEFDSSVRDAILRQELEGGRVEMKKKPLAYLVPAGAIVGVLVLLVVGVNIQTILKRSFQGSVRTYEHLEQSKLDNGLLSESGGYGWKVKGEPFFAGDFQGNFLNNYSTKGIALAGKPLGTLGFNESQTAMDSYVDRTVMHMGGATRTREKDMRNKETEYTYAASSPTMALGIDSASNGMFGYDDWRREESKTLSVASVSTDVLDEVARERIDKVHQVRDTAKKLASVHAESQSGSLIVIQPVMPATGEGEMIIRTGHVGLEVEDGNQTYQKASEICKELGGYISNSSFSKDREGREIGTITMRIPQDRFDTALEELGKLGKLEGMNTSSRDVGQEYANLKAQLDAKKVIYDKMLEALNKRRVTIPEAIRIESQLTPVARGIENLKNQIEYLQNQVSFTTITLNFREPKVSPKALKETKRIIKETALATAINTVKIVAAAIPAIVIIGFWVVAIIVLIVAVKYIIIRLFKREE